jgi:hypothetical protein
MFRLAGENDAESILKFKVLVQFQLKEFRDTLPHKVLVVPEVGDGVFNTPSQSLVNAYELGDVRKNATIILQEQLYMMVE